MLADDDTNNGIENSEESGVVSSEINSEGGNNGYLVRNVSEINGGNSNENSGDSAKRKFPSSASLRLTEELPHSSRNGNVETMSAKRCKMTECSDGAENATADINQNNETPEESKEMKKEPKSEPEESTLTDQSSSTSAAATNIKIEPEISTPIAIDEQPSVSNSAESLVSASDNTATTSTIKIEPGISTSRTDEEHSQSSNVSASNISDVRPAVKVEQADASSTTSRESCRYGIRCYRRNPMHRQEEAHPGDSDYRRPDFPAPPSGTPDCPFGNTCYRRNPTHFQLYNHPPDS